MIVGVIVGVTVGVLVISSIISILVPFSLTIVIKILPLPIFFSTFSIFPGTTDSKEITLIGANSEADIIYGSHLNPLPLLLYFTNDNNEGEGETDRDIDGVTEGDCVIVTV